MRLLWFGKKEPWLMERVLLDDEAKTYLTEKYNTGRDKKFHRKYRPAEKATVA